MTYKQIEASREARLWIGQVIVPVVVGAVALATNQEVRYTVGKTAKRVKTAIRNKFKKD